MAAPHATSPSPPWLTELGWSERFHTLDLIGSGGMGQVWRAREVDADRIVALKVLSPNHTGDEHLLARLDVEAATLSKLRDAGQHQHIVPIIDFKVSDTHACLVMEYIPGLNLRKWCDTHQLSLTKRVELMSQVARAAGWFHSLDVIHRDLKPANILVSAVTHQPVIVDFSIAKLDDTLPLTLTNEALGTAPYMAPEQLDRSRGEITHATDVYALGVTLYELLTHVLPHPGELPQIIQRHQEEVRPARPSLINKDVPRDLESICLKALSPRPQDRYANGEELATDLDRFLAGEPVIARPMSTVLYVVRQAKRKPSLTAAVAACLVISGIAITSVRRVEQQRHLRELESLTTTAMQEKSWSVATLRQVETALEELTQLDSARGRSLRQSFQNDVRSDIESTVQQSFLRAEDTGWLRDVAMPWLSKSQDPSAAQTQELITQRLSRWESLATVRAPFRGFAGLFPRTPMIIKGDLIYPNYERSSSVKEGEYSPSVVVKEDLRTPLEVTCAFVANPTTFRRVDLAFEFRKVRTEVILYKVRQAPKDLLESMEEGANLPPDALILVAARGKQVKRMRFIPDTHLLNRDFRITVRIEGNHLEADVNGKWNLAIDDVLVFASTTTTNWFQVSWPSDLGLREMLLRTRTVDVRNPLEFGDTLLAQNQWNAAHREYEQWQGDPTFGIEADYKNAWALSRMGQHNLAAAIWERLSLGPPSLWHDASAYRLWYAAALNEGMIAARPYLQRLPDPEHLHPGMKAIITNINERATITKAYAPPAQAVNVLRSNINEVKESVKAMHIMGESDLRIAIKLSMGLHSNGLDNAALKMLGEALEKAEHTRYDTTDQFSARVALDEYTRIACSEKDKRLSSVLKVWCKTYPENSHYAAIASQEAARVQARAGRYEEALRLVQPIHESKDVDSRLVTYTWLLEGMIQRLRGNESQAHEAWQQGVASIAQVRSRSDLHLTDCIVLHSLARSWSRETVIDVLVRLLGMSRSIADSESLQSVFITSLLNNDDFPRALNSLLDKPRGQELARNSVLRSKTARETNRAWYTIMIEQYFTSTAFPASISDSDQVHVQSAVEHLLESFASNRGDVQDFFDFLQVWNSPPLSKRYLSEESAFAPALVARMKWLLAQRYLQLGKPEAAKPLLESVKNDPSLDQAWRQSIAKQLH